MASASQSASWQPLKTNCCSKASRSHLLWLASRGLSGSSMTTSSLWRFRSCLGYPLPMTGVSWLLSVSNQALKTYSLFTKPVVHSLHRHCKLSQAVVGALCAQVDLSCHTVVLFGAWASCLHGLQHSSCCAERQQAWMQTSAHAQVYILLRAPLTIPPALLPCPCVTCPPHVAQLSQAIPTPQSSPTESTCCAQFWRGSPC